MGPEWYFKNQEFSIESEDTLEVQGFRNNSPAENFVIIATQLTKGEDVLVLRNDQGAPLWRGMSRRQL